MRNVVWIFLALLTLCLGLPCGSAKDIDKQDEFDSDNDNDDDDYDPSPLLLNPDYVEPDEYDDEECDEDQEGSGGNDTEGSPKSALGRALIHSRNKHALKLWKKHKAKLIVALVIFAFRKEIGHVAYRIISVPVYDHKTGKQVARTINISPTSILKVIFFLQFMVRIYRGPGGDQISDPTSAGMLPSDHASVFFLPFKSSVHVPPISQHWTFERINERHEKDILALQKAVGSEAFPSPGKDGNSTPLSPLSLSTLMREFLLPKQSPRIGNHTGTVIVMDLTKLTTGISQMDELRDQVSLLLSQHHANQTRYENTTQVAQLEVVVLLESPGGGASDYGLAAQQLLRLRKEPGIKLTVCVDKVAASGGYMMAATAHEILAAPFAVIGSIGVYGQAINIHDVLESWRVRDLVFRAGRNKAPLGLLGEVTQDGKETIQSMIDATHIAFKRHIVTARPSLEGAIDDIATGDVWLGYNALGKGLIDRLVTSDEYLGERIRQGARVLKLVKYRKPFFLGPRTSSEYSMASIVKALMAELKAFLLNDESPANLNARSFTANTVQTKSQIL